MNLKTFNNQSVSEFILFSIKSISCNLSLLIHIDDFKYNNFNKQDLIIEYKTFNNIYDTFNTANPTVN